MQETKRDTGYTPGPWRVERLPADPDQWAICGPDTAAVGVTIGSVDARHPMAEGNAAVIEQAPALVDALRALIPWATGSHPEADEAVEEARAVLAQINGEG